MHTKHIIHRDIKPENIVLIYVSVYCNVGSGETVWFRMVSSLPLGIEVNSMRNTLIPVSGDINRQWVQWKDRYMGVWDISLWAIHGGQPVPDQESIRPQEDSHRRPWLRQQLPPKTSCVPINNSEEEIFLKAHSLAVVKPRVLEEVRIAVNFIRTSELLKCIWNVLKLLLITMYWFFLLNLSSSLLLFYLQDTLDRNIIVGKGVSDEFIESKRKLHFNALINLVINHFIKLALIFVYIDHLICLKGKIIILSRVYQNTQA